MKSKWLLIFLCLLSVGCNSGLGVNFEKEFAAISIGDSQREVIATLHTEPLTTESYSLGGFSVTRLELSDLQYRYAVILASTPLSEPRVIAKSQLNIKSIL